VRILGNHKGESHVRGCVRGALWPPDTSAKRTPTDLSLPTLVPSPPVNPPNRLTSSHP
ncbi:hypothetical protein CROQUDRAFT_662474, partial [Cronartium quercuum f. sp. fusiforme G11]